MQARQGAAIKERGRACRRSAAIGTSSALLCASPDCHGPAGAPCGRPAPLSFQAPLAGRDHAYRDGTYGTAGETFRLSACSSFAFGEVFGCAGAGVQMETPDRAGTAAAGHPIDDSARRRPDDSTLADRFHADSRGNGAEALQPGPFRHGRNYTWPELMKRVWELDVLECPRCLGQMKIVAAIHSPDAIRKILDSMGLPSRAPPIAAAARTSSDPLQWS